jgi:hypothetical protein
MLLDMKLFRRRGGSDKPVSETGPAHHALAGQAAAAKQPPNLPQVREISLSAEQKSMLERSVDPRGNKILKGTYASKAAAEHALDARGTTDFPHADASEKRVIQDEHGFWRIVEDPGPDMSSSQMLDGL